VAAAVDDMRRLEKVVATMPLGRPIGPEAEVTSGFGVRLDPFLRRPALHGGIDFRAETGTPVQATAPGRVKEAGWQSGFGNMVEIDHANGLSTVFAHLSAIEVVEGQRVLAGQSVGRVGSTGRSTGPHLHYETRIAGEAVDPQRFLRAGVRLGLNEPN
ncbi:MAG: M23 family metallopeptidase, partial [Bacteroidales bacterium]|nr:M23 family metallopeptidase [Bacteroidales bacterium]